MYYTSEENYYSFTLQEFIALFEKDPTGVAQDLVDTYNRTTCSQLSNLVDHFLHLPKVEKR